MQTVEEIYTQSIRPLPERDRRKLASMILDGIEEQSGSREFYGWWNGRQITKEEYLMLDHNERIDFDVAQEYYDRHEDED